MELQLDQSVSDELLEGLLTDVTERLIGRLYSRVDDVVDCFAKLDPSAVNVQRLIGRLWIAAHAGYPKIQAVNLLLARFPADTRWLPAATRTCVRLALGIRALLAHDLSTATDNLQALLEGKDLDNQVIATIANFILGQCWQRRGQYDIGRTYVEKAHQMAVENGLTKLAAVISVTLAWVRFQQGERDVPRKMLADARHVLSETDDYVTLANIESALGRIARRVGQHESASGFFNNAIAYCRLRPGQERYLARAIQNLAFERRLIARIHAQELDYLTETRRKEARIECEFTDLIAEQSKLIAHLAEYDATLAQEWEAEAVRRFARKGLTALARYKESTNTQEQRAITLEKIRSLREFARTDLAIAEELYASVADREGSSRVNLTRGYLELDEQCLDAALASARRAYGFSEPGGVLGMARAVLLRCMIRHEQADQCDDKCAELLLRQAALQDAQEAADLVRGTQHVRLLGKISLWIGISLASTGDLERARASQNESKRLLQSITRDFVQGDIQRLASLLGDNDETDLEVGRLARGITGPGVTRRALHHAIDRIAITAIWKQERNIARIAARLRMAEWKVADIVRELNLH